MERTILLKDLKFCWIQKILLNHQNNFVGILRILNKTLLQKILIF